MTNYVEIEFPAVPENVEFARVAMACFASQINSFVLEEIDDIRLLTSEAVSNSIIHGYPGRPGIVRLRATIADGTLEMIVEDEGRGIPDVKRAMQPAFTTREDRLGMGFTIMEALADELEVYSEENKGTRVVIRKRPARSA
ncbi:MAG TPA: anti-sigma F factor [Firmicutes bacterium]|nr:anti-sigma F factor [Bacillota bacterium]